jgi:hypothetical protein
MLGVLTMILCFRTAEDFKLAGRTALLRATRAQVNTRTGSRRSKVRTDTPDNTECLRRPCRRSR